MIEHKLPYTAKQIEDRLEYVGNMIESGIDANLAGYAKTDDIPTKVSKLENDLKFVTQEWLENEYDSNNEPLVVNLLADGTTDKSITDISVALLKNRQVLASQGDSTIALTGLRGESAFFSGVVNGEEVAITVTGNIFEIIYTKLATEQFVSDGYQPKGEYLTAVPDGYAKTSDIPTKPEDIGAQPAGNYALKTEIPNVPVQSVNGKTGAVQLSASDVGALPNTYTPPNQTAEQVGADPKGAAASAVSQHNAAEDSHNDIRLELKAINERLTAFFDSDDKTLDELSEIVAYITSNKTLIDSITTSKVNVTDIINDLVTNVANKPLSAAQGVVLKGLIDTLSNSLSNYQPKGDYALKSELPTKVSQLQNDKGYLTEHQDISGKLDANKLPEAVNDALAQAKASGEFDGEDGDPGKDGVSPTVAVSKSGKVTTVSITDKNGTKTATINDGTDGSPGTPGQRGTGLLPVTSAPSSYTTAVGGITPKYRMALSTIKTQSGATEVLLGDTIRYSYYHYPIAYLDASYAYFTTRVSIRGTAGADGYSIYCSQNRAAENPEGGFEILLESIINPNNRTLKIGDLVIDSTSELYQITNPQPSVDGFITMTFIGDLEGEKGVGISTVKQTITSTADGGDNVITVTLTDGTSRNFTVKNGSKGSTPVKGTDYFTAKDKTEIVNAVIAALPVYTGEVI